MLCNVRAIGGADEGKEGVTEQLKVQNQMFWVGMMNSVKASAKEIVMKELVYGYWGGAAYF